MDELDSTEQYLWRLAGKSTFDRALSTLGRVCCRRAQLHGLPTAAARGLIMMKLCLIVVPEAERRVTLEQWKKSSVDVAPN